MRFLWIVLLMCCGCPAVASGLYEGGAIVTGMDMRSRPDGLSRALAQVLVKVSGNPALARDARLGGVDPGPLMQGFGYLDRMSDQPKRDEQGTRDRPYDLIVQFRPGEIDTLLRSWNEVPWPLPRPPLAVGVEIWPRAGAVMRLLADTDADERHRAALLSAAGWFGLDVLLPATMGAAAVPPDAPVLHGTLRWSDEAAGWISAWRLSWRGMDHAWGQRGTGFDAAYRDGIAGSVRILSGH